MITYCPSCNTHFRVYAEQLAVRAGQVRCGKCSRVFDALANSIEEAAPARAPRPKPEFEAMRADAADAEPVPESPTRETPDIGATAQKPAIVQAADVVAESPHLGVETPEAAILIEPEIAQSENAESVAISGASAFGFGPVAAAAPSRRWPWLLGAFPLLLILLAQAAYHYRSVITLHFPEAKPYAAALCASLGCELPLPRRIEQMSIEASDLQADTTNPNVMVLSATLRNRAIFNQQYPSLDLTLTDAQDQPVVRRVLAPHDYLGKAVNAQAGFAGDSEIEIKVYIEGSRVKATGYRLDRFFP